MYKNFDKFLLSLIILGQIQSSHAENNRKLSIEVYYSALDLNSSVFLKTQLKGVIESDLVEYIDLRLYPFANCKVQWTPNEIKCDQGTNETLANLRHWCAYRDLNNNSPLSFNLPAVRYALCTVDEIDEFHKELTVEKCKNHLGNSAEKIENCIKDRDYRFLKDVFDRLGNITVTNLPVIILNGTFCEKINKQARNMFWDILCIQLGPYGPDHCRKGKGVRKDEPNFQTKYPVLSPYLSIFILVLVFLQ